MSSAPRATEGFKVHAILLERSSFARHLQAESKSGTSGAQGHFDLDVKRNLPPTPITRRFTESLTVTARGLIGSVETWRAEATYLGEFELAEDSEVSIESATTVHVPALLYGFAREHLADLTRRSLVGQLMLPPMRFVEDEAQAETVADVPVPTAKKQPRKR